MKIDPKDVFILAVTTISWGAGQAILRQNTKAVAQANDLREVGMALGKFAAYQNSIIEEKLVDLDIFDRIVFDNLTADLKAATKRLHDLSPPEDEK